MTNIMITFHLYTIKDLRRWLLNCENNGVSDKMITRSRAWALVNNPCAKDSDVVISAVRDDDVVIGYTAIFAEQFQNSFHDCMYYWGTTQWIEPEYRGKGISAQMMWQLKEIINHRYLGLDSSIASCKLDQKQGYNIKNYSRYFFQLKRKNSSLKSFIKQLYVTLCNDKIFRLLSNYSYTNRYISFVDNMTYDFIQKYSKQDLFLRKQEMLTWILQYPFWCEIGDDVNVETESCMFSSHVKQYKISAVQVYENDMLCGVYFYHILDGVFKLLYLYHDNQTSDTVYASIINLAFQLKVAKFCTMDKNLYDFMISIGVKGMYSKNNIENISLTLPPGMKVDESLNVQGGDGDMFC